MKRIWLVLLAALLVPGGCTENTATSHGRSAALDSGNLLQMTDDMSAKILASPAVQEELARKGRLRVVVQPVENKMTGEVLPKGPANAYMARLRSLLQDRAADRFTWVMNRDAWYALRNGEVDPGPDPDRVQPEYALTASFYTITDESSKHRTLYYLCVYRLTDLEGGLTLWTDKYEVKKTVVKGFLD